MNTNLVLKEFNTQGVKMGEGNVFSSTFKIEHRGIGSIIIGNNNLFSDNVMIINETDADLVIGDYNHFRVGCTVMGNIGNGNEIGVNSVVNVDIGDDCKVETRSVLNQEYQSLPQNSFLSGSGKVCVRLPTKSNQVEHIQLLQQILPKYHNIKYL